MGFAAKPLTFWADSVFGDSDPDCLSPPLFFFFFFFLFLENRTFQPEVGCRLPGLPVQVAGLTVLGVQLGGRRSHRQEVPEVHRRLHEQTPVQDHSIQRLQGERRRWLNIPSGQRPPRPQKINK